MAQVGWTCDIMPVDIAEDLRSDIPIKAAIMELALRKAQAGAANVANAGAGLVIAADTVVVIDNRVLGKPASEQEASAMLQTLSGREHRVITGVAVISLAQGEYMVEAEETGVVFKALTDAEIARYVASGEPMDKAGAYGIQGKGAILVKSINGCYFNVVGLPLTRLAGMLQAFGYTKAYSFSD